MLKPQGFEVYDKENMVQNLRKYSYGLNQAFQTMILHLS